MEGYDEASEGGFFERERNRLIQDISKGVETVLGNANGVNRKLEETVSVGDEFHPIAQLWSRFANIMHAAGIPNLHPTPAEPNSAAKDKPNETEVEDEGIRIDSTPALPPGVAPGGGRIYAA